MFIPGYDSPTLIGRGGFAHVYRAHQQAFYRDVAVKILLVSLDHERDRRRFARECAAMGRLTGHPHIVTVLESGVTPDGNPYLTTPYYEHGTLADRIRTSGPRPVDEVLTTGVALAGALDLAHTTGILHRDVKPANVLLSAYDEPALADFGIAVIAAESGELSQVTHAFTITHAPPEILDGRRATEATDVYSLASTLWTALTGVAPFGPDDGDGLAARVERVQHQPVPPIERPDVPAALEAALVDALAKDPDQRPSAHQLGERLRDIQRDRGSTVTPLRSGPSGLDVAVSPQPASPTGTIAWHDGTVRWADDEVGRVAFVPMRSPAPPPPIEPARPASIRIDPPEAVGPPLLPVAPPPSRSGAGRRDRRGRTRAAVIAVACAVVVVGFLIGSALARSRPSDGPVGAPPTTAATTTTAATPADPGPSSTATPAPSTAAPPPATAIVAPGAPGPVRDAARTAQDGANALATDDWDAARTLIGPLGGASDASLAASWGGLERSTLVLVDWKERGPATDLRLGQVAVEQVDGTTRTSLYCVTWTVRDGTIVDMADQQVVAVPWQPGVGEALDAEPVPHDACRSLGGGRGGD